MDSGRCGVAFWTFVVAFFVNHVGWWLYFLFPTSGFGMAQLLALRSHFPPPHCLPASLPLLHPPPAAGTVLAT